MPRNLVVINDSVGGGMPIATVTTYLILVAVTIFSRILSRFFDIFSVRKGMRSTEMDSGPGGTMIVSITRIGVSKSKPLQ